MKLGDDVKKTECRGEEGLSRTLEHSHSGYRRDRQELGGEAHSPGRKGDIEELTTERDLGVLKPLSEAGEGQGSKSIRKRGKI